MKKHYITFIAGLLIGALCFGAVTVAADSISATPSKWKIFVDGNQTDVEVYTILGSNFLKLRDVCAAVDVGLWYDSNKQEVYIERDKGYDPNYTGSQQSGSVASSPDSSKYYPIAFGNASYDSTFGANVFKISLKNHLGKDIKNFTCRIACYDAYGKPVIGLMNNYIELTGDSLKNGEEKNQNCSLIAFPTVRQVYITTVRYITSDGTIVEIPESEWVWASYDLSN